ncbi:MAG: L,D-transpeptidase family protein [Microbacterium sp.]|uniref:L,D-transpeptidase family protein n=1 Tax=Microbacterium sp. TaxID=51671 RepID=UPI003F812087
MTDLATQPQADKASAGDAVEVEPAVGDAVDAEFEGSPTDDSDVAAGEPADETANAADATDEVADDTDATEPDAATDETQADETQADETAESEADATNHDAADAEATDEIAAGEADATDDVDAAEGADQADAADADAPAETDAAGEAPDAEATAEADDPSVEAATDAVDAESLDEPPLAAEAEPAADVAAADTADEHAATVVVATTAVAQEAAAAEASDTAVATTVLPTTTAAPDADAAAAAPPAGTDGAVYAWAEPEPKPKKKRTALWLSIGAGVAVVGLLVSSLLLIAPGTTVAGVPVGWMTPGAAADAIQKQLATTTVVLTGDGGDAEVTGADLGASVDAKALADAAFSEHPMWNPTAWFAETGAEVELDTPTALEALQKAAPALFTDPVDATLAYDGASTSYVSTPATPGAGIDVATVQQALQAAFEAGKKTVNLDPVIAEVPAAISTETAADTATKLNGMISNIGFYVGDERTVPVDRAVAASWLTVTPENGAFTISADPADIQPVVDTLAGAVDRAPENAVEITDRAGKVLQTIAAGQSGRQLGATAGIAAAFAAQLAGGDPVYKLPVDEVPVSTTTLARNIVVDLSDQAAYFYENGVVVSSTRMSSGLPGHDTHTGSFRITAKLRIQNMGNPDLTKAPYYYTKNVPWVMYFNGDQALHGAYWHNNFGNRMSHGCVNLPVGVAEFLYQWAPMGTEVTVQN